MIVNKQIKIIHNNNKDYGISDYDIRDYNEIKTKSKSIILKYKKDNTEKYQCICSGVAVQLGFYRWYPKSVFHYCIILFRGPLSSFIVHA